jgi:hypothetical protein
MKPFDHLRTSAQAGGGPGWLDGAGAGCGPGNILRAVARRRTHNVAGYRAPDFDESGITCGGSIHGSLVMVF